MVGLVLVTKLSLGCDKNSGSRGSSGVVGARIELGWGGPAESPGTEPSGTKMFYLETMSRLGPFFLKFTTIVRC